MAGIIKRERTASVSSFSYQDLENYARRLLTEARTEAKAIVQAAEQQAEVSIAERRRTAYEEGLAEGRQAGLAQIEAEAREKVFADYRDQLSHTVGILQETLTQFTAQKERLLAQAESGLLELALAIAQRVCKRAVAQSSEVAIDNVRHVLEIAGRTADPELHINPHDEAAIREWAEEFIRTCEKVDHVRLVADDTVSPGGCRLRGRHVAIDATLETQLDRIATAICHPPDDGTTTA